MLDLLKKLSIKTYVGRELRLTADAQSLAECREIYRELKGKYLPRFPMPLFLFRKFVGQVILNMWRWPRTNPVELDTHQAYELHPEAMIVPTWLRSMENS